MKIHHPESIKEAINDLEAFLECDLYSKFRPAHKRKDKTGKLKTWYRQDSFPNEKEFIKYLRDHFEILEKHITKLIGKKEYSKVRGKK